MARKIFEVQVLARTLRLQFFACTIVRLLQMESAFGALLCAVYVRGARLAFMVSFESANEHYLSCQFPSIHLPNRFVGITDRLETKEYVLQRLTVVGCSEFAGQDLSKLCERAVHPRNQSPNRGPRQTCYHDRIDTSTGRATSI